MSEKIARRLLTRGWRARRGANSTYNLAGGSSLWREWIAIEACSLNACRMLQVSSPLGSQYIFSSNHTTSPKDGNQRTKITYSSPPLALSLSLPTSSHPLFLTSSLSRFSALSLAFASLSSLNKVERSGCPSWRLVAFVRGLRRLSKALEVDEGRTADWGTDLSRWWWCRCGMWWW